MPAIDPETPRAETAIRAILDHTQPVASSESTESIEDTLATLASEADAAQERLDRAMSLARNWMGLTDARISTLIGVSPTTVARRDSHRIRESITELILATQETG